MEVPRREAFRSRCNYFAAWLSEVGQPILRIWANSLARGPRTPPGDWEKVLLVGANHIGDILYLTGSIGALSEAFPESRLHIILPAPACEVVECHGEFAKIHRFDPPRRHTPEFEILKAENYDAAICYDSGMYYRPLKLAVDLGIPNRVGYVHKGLSGWVTRAIRIDFPKPFPAYFRDLVAQLTGKEPKWPLRPVVFSTGADRSEALELRQSLRIRPDGRLVACFTSTRQPTGVWPANYFGRLVQLLEADGIDVVLCGETRERESLERLRRQNRLRAPVIAGVLGLRALAEFLRECGAVICPDSGPRHLANAAGVPVFFFRNLRSSKIESGKYCETEYDLAPDLELLPPGGQARHLRQTRPEDVYSIVRKALN
jgi:ADP-heptose:LPS heptosyltransferase